MKKQKLVKKSSDSIQKILFDLQNAYKSKKGEKEINGIIKRLRTNLSTHESLLSEYFKEPTHAKAPSKRYR